MGTRFVCIHTLSEVYFFIFPVPNLGGGRRGRGEAEERTQWRLLTRTGTHRHQQQDSHPSSQLPSHHGTSPGQGGH